MQEILTERVRLRPLRENDLDARYLAVFSDPEVSWSGRARSVDESRASLDAKLAHVREHGFGMMAAIDRETGELLGYAGLQHFEDGPEVEIGYYFGRSPWGRGLATEIARALVEHGFSDLGLERIVAVVRPENQASQRVLAKAGLRCEGTGHHYGADVQVWALARL
jgi:RimJ/RimL family protein N-acetyltransferase